MESGDYVASVVSGNSKLLKVSSYTKDGAVTLKDVYKRQVPVETDRTAMNMEMYFPAVRN